MRCIKVLLIIFLALTGALPAGATGVLTPEAGGGTVSIQESDGSPSVGGVGTIIVTNGSLTDNGDGSVAIATSGAANVTIDSSVVTGGTASSLLYVGAGPVLKQVSITGLVLGNGASAPSAYTGATCTGQVLRVLSAAGAGTCVTITSAYVDTSIWTGTVSSGILKATSQGVLAQASSGTDYVIPSGNTATATALAANGGNCTAGQFPLGVDTLGAVESCTALPTTITGTANEIQATAATGPITLSLPAVINTSSKTLRIPNGTSLPGTCTLGDQFMDTDATLGQQLYLCTSTNTFTLQGDGGGGGAGTVTSVDAVGGVQTASGSAITTSGTVRGAHVANAQVGTTYTVLTGDRGKFITFSNSGAIAVTLPQAGTGFENGWFMLVKNIGAGTVTITPTTSTINDGTDLALATTQSTFIVSDGTNYTSTVLPLLAEVDTLATVLARGRVDSGATSSANAVQIGGATDKWKLFHDGTTGLEFIGVCGGVDNDCDYYRKLNAGKKAGFKDSGGNIDFEYTESSGKISAMTANVEDSGVTLTTVTKVNFPTVGCSGTTGTLMWDTNATLAPVATCIAGATNTTLIKGYADFPDSASDTQMQISAFRLPLDWTGAVDAQIYWLAAATSGDVVWQLATMCTSDAEIEDVAWNTADAFAADTAKGTTLQLNTVSKTGLTMTNCAAGDLFHLKVLRNNSTSGDTITGVVSLKNVELTFRRAQ